MGVSRRSTRSVDKSALRDRYEAVYAHGQEDHRDARALLALGNSIRLNTPPVGIIPPHWTRKSSFLLGALFPGTRLWGGVTPVDRLFETRLRAARHKPRTPGYQRAPAPATGRWSWLWCR